VLRNAISGREIPAGSKEISAMLARLHQFQIGALSSDDELRATVFCEQERRVISTLEGVGSATRVVINSTQSPLRWTKDHYVHRASVRVP
jgi:hypothetical protein